MEVSHHFVHFPLDFNTTAIRLGIDSISLLQSSTVIEGKVSSTRDHNSSILLVVYHIGLISFSKLPIDFL